MMYTFLMKIYIYSPQKEISQIIADHLSDKGNLCFPFMMQEDISVSLQNLKKMPDLLILDYKSFNHDIFNIFDYLKKFNMKVPLVFYNDPCLLRSSRTQHWISIIETKFKPFEEEERKKYEKVLKDLEELIESDELRPYISLLQEPKEIPLSMIKDAYTLQYLKENKDDCIFEFQKRTKLPNNLFYLLELLQKNKCLSLSFTDIADLYNKDGKSINEKSLKVLMSRLKSFIRSDKNCNFLIHCEDKRYKFVRFKV